MRSTRVEPRYLSKESIDRMSSLQRSHLRPQKPGFYVYLSLLNVKIRRNPVSRLPCVEGRNPVLGSRGGAS
ncbi:hypothetical protein [Microcoleus sp. D2_18a_D3]|uniref:hypothetical protein n=1 Tax=Microcoleus sp. D2_18a_D3 TaxID=3055330 RepID=UPI002FD25871